MATNDFLTFGASVGANVLTQAEYAALLARSSGFVSGTANSAQLNKVWRQSSIISSVIGQFIANRSGQNAVDDGTTAALLANLEASMIALAGHGQCRLSVASATQLKLVPYNGNKLLIGGVTQQIPSAGITISNSGLLASTLYYVYVAMVSGAMAMVLSTTGHVTDATTGVEVQSGNAARTLVGMVYTTSATQFADSNAQRLCINWFNRRLIVGNQAFAASRSTTSTTLVEISSTERIEFLTWGEAVFASSPVDVSQNTGTGDLSTNVYIDAVNLSGRTLNPPSGQRIYACPQAGSSPSEGYHTVRLYGAAVSGFTTTWQLSSTVLTLQMQG